MDQAYDQDVSRSKNTQRDDPTWNASTFIQLTRISQLTHPTACSFMTAYHLLVFVFILLTLVRVLYSFSHPVPTLSPISMSTDADSEGKLWMKHHTATPSSSGPTQLRHVTPLRASRPMRMPVPPQSVRIIPAKLVLCLTIVE